MATNRKLDLFGTLRSIDKKEIDFYDKLTDDAQKEFQPLVIQRWMSGCDDPFQINALNEFTTPYVFDFGKNHKELLAKLFVACAGGTPKRYKWVKASTRNTSKFPVTQDVIARYYNTSQRHAKTYISLLCDSAI